MKLNPLTMLLLFTFCLALPGCGGGIRTVPVEGKVTLKGQPFQNVRSGSVTFTPAEGKGNPLYGDIQPDGSFSMKTNAKTGVPPGEYRVAVIVYSHEYEGDNRLGDAPPKLLSPPKYADTSASGLTQTIPAGGVKDMVINLE